MPFDQAPRQRQADAEAAVAAVAVPGKLREHVEDVRQHAVGNADPVVLHAHDDVGARGGCVDADVSAAGRVLDGVVQQVVEHLHEPRRVRVGPERHVRQIQLNAVALSLDDRPRRVDRGVQHGAQVDPLASHLQLSLCDARHVEQVVGQPDQLHQLPLHRLARFLDDVGFVPGQAHDLEGAA